MKILFITLHYPPIIGMSSMRLNNFTKNLAAAGHQIDVLTIKPLAHHPNYFIDKNHKKIHPNNIRIFRTYPGLLYQFVCWVNKIFGGKPTNVSTSSVSSLRLMGKIKKIFKPFMIPDGKFDWFFWSYPMGLKLMKKNNYDFIFSHGFPWTTHFIAYYLKKKHKKVSWFADFGDPWSFGPDDLKFPSWRRRLDYFLESKILKFSDKIIVFTKETKDAYLKFFHFLKPEKIEVITAGIDEDEYKKIEADNDKKKFTAVYTGIFDDSRNPQPLLEALEKFKNKKNFRVRVIGMVDNKYLNLIKKLKLDKIVCFEGHLPHSQCVAAQKGATILLNLGWPLGYQLPAKMIEYLSIEKTILTIYSDQNDLSINLVRSLNRGLAVENKVGPIIEILDYLYQLWQNNKLSTTFSLQKISDFYWSNLSSRLEKLFIDYAINRYNKK